MDHIIRFWGAHEARPQAPVIFLAQGEDAQEEWTEIISLLKPGCCRLVGFESSQWNDAYSPWPGEAVFAGQDSFGGDGGETLRWLEETALKRAGEYYSLKSGYPCAIAGYSLAGLFALWAFYHSGRFCGCASCSGSLWYHGWTQFLSGREAPEGSAVYLSLGCKEERSRNTALSSVGERTRETLTHLQMDPAIRRCVLEWNPGGHFQDHSRRIARGIEWLSESL